MRSVLVIPDFAAVDIPDPVGGGSPSRPRAPAQRAARAPAGMTGTLAERTA